MGRRSTKEVLFIVGHRKSSQGAYGSAGMSEYDYNNAFVDDLISRLNSNKVAKMLRQDKKGYTLNMKELHERIDKLGAKYAIAFHFNAASTPKANGHEILYWERSRQSRLVAKMFDSSYDNHLKNKDRNIKPVHKGRGGGFLRRGKSINVLVEPYFAYHQKEFMPGTEGYENLMSATIEVVSRLLGEEVKTREKPVNLYPRYHYMKKKPKGKDKENGEALQRLLNQGGAKLKVDGWTGRKTSDAVKRQFGFELKR